MQRNYRILVPILLISLFIVVLVSIDSVLSFGSKFIISSVFGMGAGRIYNVLAHKHDDNRV